MAKKAKLESLIPELMTGIKNELLDNPESFDNEENVRVAFDLLDSSYQGMRVSAQNGMQDYSTQLDYALEALETLAEESVEDSDSEKIIKAITKLRKSKPYQLFSDVKKEAKVELLYGSRRKVPEQEHKKILSYLRSKDTAIYKSVNDLGAAHQTDILERMRLYIGMVKKDDMGWDTQIKMGEVVGSIEARLDFTKSKKAKPMMERLDAMAKELLGNQYPTCRIDMENRRD